MMASVPPVGTLCKAYVHVQKLSVNPRDWGERTPSELRRLRLTLKRMHKSLQKDRRREASLSLNEVRYCAPHHFGVHSPDVNFEVIPTVSHQ